MLEIVRAVPTGKVVSYGQVALMAGIPRAAQQVGWILCTHGEKVPWWRVINNAGRISTTCLDHTAQMQKKFLKKEGITVTRNLKIDIERYRWRPDPDTLQKLELNDEYVDMVMDKFMISTG